MNAVAEFRIPESDAARVLKHGVGKTLGDSVRVVRAAIGSPIYEEIGRHHLARRRSGPVGLFMSWDISRRYTPEELWAAELLHLRLRTAFEPPGEECGTVYDESGACEHCGYGRVQTSPLSVALRPNRQEHDIETHALSATTQLARSIANEIVVGSLLVDVLTKAGAHGYELAPVVRCSSARPVVGWQQLFITRLVSVAPSTIYGIDPFDLDDRGEFRCPRGHVLGLNLLSELVVDRQSWDGSDIAATRELSGQRVGLLVPEPEIVISQRLYRVLAPLRLRSVSWEVARFD